MSNKTISINPSLFSLVNIKTKKNRERKNKKILKPIITPNVLKNKLLKRIKEHKQRETQNLENKSKNNNTTNNSNSNSNRTTSNHEDIKNDTTTQSYSDEFSDSINYLQTLSKQKKVNDEKTNYEKQKQKRKEMIDRRTIKNYNEYNNENNVQPYVNIDLPEELKITVNTENMTPNNYIKLNSTKDEIPYGILKGGLKPTYRDWTRRQRDSIVTNPNSALTIRGDGITKEKIERELRLNNLREKLKNKQLEESIIKNEEPLKSLQTQDTQNNTNISVINDNISKEPTQKSENYLEESNKINELLEKPIIVNDTVINNSNNSKTNIENNNDIIAIKKITKRTIKKKYTLGKSKIKKSVSVLVKDRFTRKKVITAQKDLKRKPITDIKLYLRDHNLIKVGSNAPNDVIRKLYESAMLAGEITNKNSETLLYNFSKDDKEI